MMKKLILGVSLLLVCRCMTTSAAEKDAPPVLAFDFEEKLEGIVRDATGGGRHGVVKGRTAYIAAPTGSALVFDGATSIMVRTDEKLAMTSGLTLDLWLRVEKLGVQQCVIDKAGERYRIAISPEGQVHFGLKGVNSRADLVGGKLIPNQWHRITATFARPEAKLYIDGVEVKSEKWENEIDAGGPLHIGARGGSSEFFHGAIDHVRIYNYARPPKTGDEKLLFGSRRSTKEAKLTMKETQGIMTVNTGPMEFELDLRTGIIRSLKVEEKHLIADNDTPPIFATIMESTDYDGVTDYAPRRLVKGEYSCAGLKPRTGPQGFVASGKGSLSFPGGDALDFDLELRAKEGAKHVQVALSLAKRGEFRNRFIREIGIQQPLALNFRKRVVQASDQGLRWDTRYHYQFHLHVEFLPEPDHNWWRHFYIDQESDHSYAIWRAESEDTAGLYPFRGRRAPGWMTLYDEQGGALFAYRELSARAPKCLYANAEDGGTGILYLVSPTQPARDVNDPRLAHSLFGKPHEMDWIFFAGEEAFAQPDRELAKLWGVESLSSDGPVKHDLLDDELDLWNAPPATGELVPLVAGGIPLPRASITKPNQVRLFVRGTESPVQTNILAYWPDGSIKWLLLIFPLDGSGGYRFEPGTGEGEKVSFRVTLRKGEPVPCELHFGREVRAGKLGTLLRAGQDGDSVRISTGPLALMLTPGERWMPSAILNGREMIRNDNQPQAFVDFLRTEKDYPVGTTHPEGELDPGPVKIEKIELEESGPLRAVVRLEGKAAAQEPPRVILRLEAYAGRSFVRLFHSVEFMHKNPRRAFVRRMGLHLPLALDPAAERIAAGGQKGPVTLQPAAYAGLRQTSHLNYEIWQMAEGMKFREVRESAFRSRGWLDVADARGGLCVILRSMWEEFPKEIMFKQKDAAFEIGLWPGSVPLMDVRRYSNYPHRAQGEATPADSRWVLDFYYRNDPFVGVSKSHELMLFFHGPGVSPAQVDSVAADCQSQPLVYAGWKWYARTGITIEHVDPEETKFKRFISNMQNLADWWLFHQKAWGWYGMWDYGDVGHRFRSGYGRIVPPDALVKILKLPPEERAKLEVNKIPQKYDYFTQNDWAFDNGRWGWSNTEGLPNLFMSMQYLLTGRRDIFFFMEANARHARDVDARHAGQWFGAGTRHGVQHWSDGNHEERQTAFTEQRFHYFLTGEHRTREWNQILSEQAYLKKGQCRVHAAHSGRTYCLLTRWEITGDLKLGEILRNYMHAFATPEGLDISPTVKFPEGKGEGQPGELHGGSMFFHTFGAMHAVLEYYNLTKDERVRNALIKTADHVLKRDPRAAGGMHRKVIAFAARHAPEAERERYRDALAKWAAGDGGANRYVFQMVPANPAHWTGETAFLTGNVSGGMFWANDAHYVMSALPAEPTLTPEQEAALKAIEERPVTPASRLPKESWQSEYDRPEFQEYLKETLRPPKAKRK